MSASERLTELHERMVPAPWALLLNVEREESWLVYDWVKFALFDGRQYLGAERSALPLAELRNALPALAAVVAAAEKVDENSHYDEPWFYVNSEDAIELEHALAELRRVLGDNQ